MLNRHDLEAREIALDACIDRMVSGDDWHAELPSEEEVRRDLLGLLAVARRLVEVASMVPSPAAEMKQRVWHRVSTSPELQMRIGMWSRLRRWRIPYTPPAQANAVHRMLFARIPGLPPLVLDYREAS